MIADNLDDYIPSLLNPRSIRKSNRETNLTQNTVYSQYSLSLRKPKFANKQTNKNDRSIKNKVFDENKEHVDQEHQSTSYTYSSNKKIFQKTLESEETISFSAIEDLISNNDGSSIYLYPISRVDVKNSSLKSLSSATELSDWNYKSEDTHKYIIENKPAYNIPFSFNNSKHVNLNIKNCKINNISISNFNNYMSIECDVIGNSDIDEEMGTQTEYVEYSETNQAKRPAVSVSLETKRQKSQEREENNILILNSSDEKKLSDVTVQPTFHKLLKRKIQERNKFIAAKRKSDLKSYGNNKGEAIYNLKQQCIDTYFPKVLKSQISNVTSVLNLREDEAGLTNKESAQDASHDMSRNLCITATKHDVAAQSTKTSKKNEFCKAPRRLSHRSMSPRVDIKENDFSPSKIKNESIGSYSPRKIVDSLQFNLPVKSKSNKTSAVTKIFPHHKIIAGTHFAVDAFSYGDIPNVKHYFLTHFHSDHYSGLKKGFNKTLYCSKITADLCISRLGVGVKYIRIMNVDESIKIDGVEVTAIDANHCPGAIMLVFTLSNGKTLLHTGDFRASPIMESYPVFWNKDIHTVYLDTTYCNPRYDFPTQDESLEMALYHLRQKKTALEKAGKKFSSVLIVCGTYTIGKEKFFLGMARRVGCSVWACPEKDRVLQAVEGRSFSHAPPHSCQLHVVPMRDLTHEKLRSYLDSLQGAFSEVVAFKPSGWENGKNTCIEKDFVTIYGIPYSEHSSFSEMRRFVKFLKPKQVVPTVDISGGIKAVQKFFPCPLIHKEDLQNQLAVT